MKVRSDHIARAVENDAWFMRGNNVAGGPDKALESDGVGSGDSYRLDPQGEVVVRAGRDVETMITSQPDFADSTPDVSRSLSSGRELGEQLLRTVEDAKPHD
jgi:predicted amidohydrolase